MYFTIELYFKATSTVLNFNGNNETKSLSNLRFIIS